MSISTRRVRSRSWYLLATLVAGGMTVAACGNSSDKSATTSPAATTAPAGTAPAGTAPTNTESASTARAPADTAAPADSAPAASAPAASTPDIGTFQPITGVPGVTDKEIDFAVLGTGPANPLGYCLLECYKAGVQAYFDYRNSLGGVNGRQLVISKTADDEMANTQVKALELIQDTSIFGIFGAPLLYAGWSDIAQAKVPLYTTFPAAVDADGHDSTFIPIGTVCANCETPMSTYYASATGKTKMASIGFGVSQASKDCVNKTESEAKRFGPGAGVEFVYKNDDLPFGFPNGLGPEVTAMKDAGVDIITTCIDQNSVITLEQELQRQGMDNVVVVLPQGYGDTAYLTDNADLLEGDVIGVPYLPVEADSGSSMLSTMIDWLQKSNSSVNDYAIQGWLGADLAVTGILAAGPTFDRASVIAATNKITDYTAGGIVPPVDWTKAHNAPKPGEATRYCMSVLTVKGGKLELLGEKTKPFSCFQLPMDAWAEPTAESFG